MQIYKMSPQLAGQDLAVAEECTIITLKNNKYKRYITPLSALFTSYMMLVPSP